MSMINSGKFAVAVDAYSSGNFFPESFAKLGVKLVHVQSTPQLMPSMLPPRLSEFSHQIVHSDLVSTIAALRDFDPISVFAGQEPGVPLADALSEAMGLASNGSRLSKARRNKYEMIETLRSAKVRCAAQIMTSNAGEVLEWLETNALSACVVKPLQSASTDGVTICNDRSIIGRAIERVLSTADIFGDRNERVLVQEYLRGPEYIVDTVSHAGSHYVCGVWRYKKRLLENGANIYERDTLISHEDPIVEKLATYMGEALDALGIAYGPAHSEVIMTTDGPTLVETGARLNGDMHPGFHDVCLGHNQADLTALQYVQPQRFDQSFGGTTYRACHPAVVYHAASERSGTINRMNEEIITAIKDLRSVHTVQVKLKPGAQLKETVDLLSSPLRVFLTHPDQAVIEEDCRVISCLHSKVYELC